MLSTSRSSTSLTGADNYVPSMIYDSASRLLTRTLGNGLTQTYTYYPWNQQGGRLRTLAAGTLQNLTYTYDPAGNILSIADTVSSETQTYTYDALDRLTSWTLNGSLQETYAYDPASGNLQTKGALTLTYGDSSHVHAVTSASNQSSVNSYQYDQNGNQTTRTIGQDTFNLLYDAESRLVEVKKNGASIAQFTYDGDGKRVKSVVNGETTLFVSSYYEQKGSQVTKYYFAGATRIAMRKYVIPQNMTVEYFLTDHLGSTSLTTDSNGAKVSEMRYKPWGEVRYTWTTGLTTTPAYRLADYTFTGQFSYMDDPTTSGVTEGFGLMFYNARWYDPSLGRFAQADTIVPASTQGIQAWDRFGYANNNPVRYTDPTGHMIDDGSKDGGGFSCKKLGTCIQEPPKQPTPLVHILGNPIDPIFCNGLEDFQGEVLSPLPTGYSSDDDIEAYTTLRGPNTPVFAWDYVIAAIDLKNYLETNFDFRNTEYKIWDLPPDVISGLFYTPAATGIRRDDESGILLTGLLVTNSFPEDIQRVDLKIQMLSSNSIVLAADQTQIITPIQSGSSTNLLSIPVFVPTNTYQASVKVTLWLYTSNYHGQIIHTIP